jgi:hypothetical protein
MKESQLVNQKVNESDWLRESQPICIFLFRRESRESSSSSQIERSQLPLFLKNLVFLFAATKQIHHATYSHHSGEQPLYRLFHEVILHKVPSLRWDFWSVRQVFSHYSNSPNPASWRYDKKRD